MTRIDQLAKNAKAAQNMSEKQKKELAKKITKMLDPQVLEVLAAGSSISLSIETGIEISVDASKNVILATLSFLYINGVIAFKDPYND